MIYMLGHSHLINVLNAISQTESMTSHDNIATSQAAAEFSSYRAKPAYFGGAAFKAMIASPAHGWGMIAELRKDAQGNQQLIASDNFTRFMQKLAPGRPDDILFAQFHGNEHSVLSMLQHPIPYDFHYPAASALPMIPGAQPLPLHIVSTQLDQHLNPASATLAALRTLLPQMRIVHIMPPPPIRSEARIRKTPEIFASAIEQHGVTPISLRLKYYLAAVEMMREYCRRLQIEWLDTPPEAVDAEGAIKDEYAFAATHANVAYGTLVGQQMHAILNRR